MKTARLRGAYAEGFRAGVDWLRSQIEDQVRAEHQQDAAAIEAWTMSAAKLEIDKERS